MESDRILTYMHPVLSTSVSWFGSRRVVAASLAVWFSLLTLAGTLIHSHTGGDRLHSHTTAPGNDSGSGPSHRHRTLFGCDLGSDCLGSGASHLADGSDPTNPTASATPDLEVPLDLGDAPFLVVELPLTKATSPLVIGSTTLCPVSRHTVSGVLLI